MSLVGPTPSRGVGGEHRASEMINADRIANDVLGLLYADDKKEDQEQADTAQTDDTPQADQKAEPEEKTEEVTDEEASEPENDEDQFIIDGETYTLKDLKENLSKRKDYTVKTKQLANERAFFEQNRQALVNQALQEDRQKLEVIAKQVMNFHQATDPWMADYQRLDRAKVAAENPQLLVQLDEMARQKVTAFQTAQRQLDQLSMQNAHAQLQAEQGKVAEKIPEWRDQTVRAKESGDIAQYLLGVGYRKEELRGLVDHRYLLVARDAMKFRRQVATQKAVADKKTPKPIQTVLKSAARRRGKSESEKGKKLWSKAKSTGRTDDITAAILGSL